MERGRGDARLHDRRLNGGSCSCSRDAVLVPERLASPQPVCAAPEVPAGVGRSTSSGPLGFVAREAVVEAVVMVVIGVLGEALRVAVRSCRKGGGDGGYGDSDSGGGDAGDGGDGGYGDRASGNCQVHRIQ